MEFENLHDHASWLTSEMEALKAKFGGGADQKVAALEARMTTLEARLAGADGLARAAMAEIKEHEAETNSLSQPATVETTNGQTDDEGPSQTATQSVRGAG